MLRHYPLKPTEPGVLAPSDLLPLRLLLMYFDISVGTFSLTSSCIAVPLFNPPFTSAELLPEVLPATGLTSASSLANAWKELATLTVGEPLLVRTSGFVPDVPGASLLAFGL
ncbi:hypothetical protein HanRHA438_Chr17g0822281 [Helianthus annuus]|nr:hypothetical protein HanHA300_Chr17g0661241 [Helianthus annuus]KAJ0448214.1 hypothetical protein HanHA89_Chr17g0714241 [Helianthus annuus]KAJ0633101.1 hypothetical protein HanLR1_Chr17g0672751 [Helianthus annuus]KAJ0827140.1 hypothetical protein HanRHA438_Chr17g0822281 [Helianthus annuus]